MMIMAAVDGGGGPDHGCGLHACPTGAGATRYFDARWFPGQCCVGLHAAGLKLLQCAADPTQASVEDSGPVEAPIQGLVA